MIGNKHVGRVGKRIDESLDQIYPNSNTPSTSTATPKGNDAAPTANHPALHPLGGLKPCFPLTPIPHPFPRIALVSGAEGAGVQDFGQHLDRVGEPGPRPVEVRVGVGGVDPAIPYRL